MVVPSIQVSHLASSSSFFSAILQPLGINFIEAPAASRNHPAVVIFGVAGQPVLRLQQAPSSHCKLSSLVFAAPSRLAVARFLEAALRADPPQSQPQANTGPAPEGARHIVDADGVAKATVLDLDGNIMEAVYPDPRPHSSVQYNGAPVRQTQSTTSEVGRILEWNYNVASSDGSPTAAGSHARRPSIPPRSITQRSALRQATSTAPALRPDDSDQGSSLINTSTVVGALLGVAAGAVLTYGIVSRDKDQALRHETPDPGPRTLPRRATFPERPPSMEVVKTNGCRDAPKAVIAPKPDPHSQALPYSNRDSLHGQGLVAGPRRSFERDDVPRQYSSRGGTRSETVHRYAPGRGGGSGGGGGKNEGTLVGKSIDASQYGHEFDSHSRLSSRHDGGRLPNVRSRSEAPSRPQPSGPQSTLFAAMPSFALGESIPPDTAHAVSVSLPTWQSNVGYEEGEDWVVGRMTTGYPRFFIHKSIQALAEDIAAVHGRPGQGAMLFPTPRTAIRCLDFVKERVEASLVSDLDVVHLALDVSKDVSPLLRRLYPTISAVLYPQEAFAFAKQYWQHTGDGASSRRAEFCHGLFKENLLVATSGSKTVQEPQARPFRGPRRYQRQASIDVVAIPAPAKSPTPAAANEPNESSQFLEERFGRNLDLGLVERAKSAIRRRIAGSLCHEVDLHNGALPNTSPNTRGLQNLAENDVYLFPAGMNAIFNAHQALLSARGQLKSINFGFPYVDTLKILQKFGPGCVFFGHASSQDLDELETLLRSGHRFLGLFCEFPGNPLLTCPDLDRIRRLADEFDFAVVVDETIGTFANINVLSVADIVVSSLTKIFSGDSNVMGGGAILNPESRYYAALKNALDHDVFEDTYWPEDVIFMERNSRDFARRVDRINANAEAICDTLRSSPLVKSLYYPKYNTSRSNYDARRLPDGGYGGLLSVVFTDKKKAQVFYDNMEIAKGPSLGTNFTLCSPYVLLAHYQELPWAAQYGVDPDLIRVSVGLEETDHLQTTFRKALVAAEVA
ncbi:cystathionine gamma-synthase [Purpureocillium lavendulum]|uniref:cystathionine gamma-synthase n=1 Tax=Purpureocillium lavendulum TaxID=1247861 RepID=A0AB34FNT9_9HYPO|nr:cystathionine gamma-synthase [Purpureocillium lavendulum]